MAKDHWRLRTAGVLAVTVLALAACGGGDDGGSSGGNDNTTAAPDDTSGGGGGGEEIGFDNGKVSFEISGDYKTKDELPFVYKEAPGGVAVLSAWDGDAGGWIAYFSKGGDSQTIVQVNTAPESLIANYGDPKATIVGTKDGGCTFDITKNDADGFKGSFDCKDVPAILAEGKMGKVDYKGSFEGQK